MPLHPVTPSFDHVIRIGGDLRKPTTDHGWLKYMMTCARFLRVWVGGADQRLLLYLNLVTKDLVTYANGVVYVGSEPLVSTDPNHNLARVFSKEQNKDAVKVFDDFIAELHGRDVPLDVVKTACRAVKERVAYLSSLLTLQSQVKNYSYLALDPAELARFLQTQVWDPYPKARND